MNISVHHPVSAEHTANLKKLVSEVHIETIISYINSLSCPKSQKLLLIEKLKESLGT